MKVKIGNEEHTLGPRPETVDAHWTGDRWTLHTSQGRKTALIARKGAATLISVDGAVYEVTQVSRSGSGHGAGNGEFFAPMPGLIADVLVVAGQEVQKGQKLVVLEAMKTQLPITAPFDGVVSEIFVEVGRQVLEGDPLVRVTEPTG